MTIIGQEDRKFNREMRGERMITYDIFLDKPLASGKRYDHNGNHKQESCKIKFIVGVVFNVNEQVNVCVID
jgi:hypothetical protein